MIISETVGQKHIVIKSYFSIFSHSVLPLITLITLFSYILYSFDTKEISSNLFLIPVMIYIYSSVQAKYEWSKKLFLYLLFTSLTLMVGVNIHFYIPKIDNFVSVVFISTSIIIFITWILSNKDVKDRIDYYFIPFLIITTMFINFNDTNISYIAISSALTILALFLLYRRKWSIFNVIPLLTHLSVFSNTTLDAKETLISMIVVSIILLVYGIRKHEYLISKTNLWSKYHIDWYSIMTIPYIIGIYGLSVYLTSTNDYSILIETMINSIAPTLFTITIYFQINRVNKSITKKIFKTITALGFMTIYYSLIANIDFNKYIETEIYLLPWIILSILLSKKVWIGYEKVMKHIQTIILLLITVTLVIDALNSNTIYDAIIVGTLSMISILSGMHFKIKSYFFVGIGVLLLNIMIQTRPLWGNTPWWVYLLLGGTTLIGFASFYEWQKQKVNHNGENIIQSKKKKIIEKLKEWN